MSKQYICLTTLNSLERVWRLLIRLDTVAILIAAVLLITILGSCFPQAAADIGQSARWETAIRTRYGVLANLLSAIGAFRWFRSPLFMIPLALLTVATFVCTLDRWRRIWRRAFQRPVSCPDWIFDSASHTACLTVSHAASPVHIVKEKLEQRGFQVRSETAGDTIYLRGDRNRLAPLATLLNHVGVLLLLLGAVISSVHGWREELTIGPDATSTLGRAGDLTLRNEGFAIARHPDSSAASYDAQIAIVSSGRAVTRCTVRVNEPLIYDNIGFYLQGFQQTANGYSVTLLAVYDPGYSVVVAAGLVLLLGLTAIFYFPHCCIRIQIRPDKTLRLAGEADRHAWDFQNEFASMVKEIKSSCS